MKLLRRSAKAGWASVSSARSPPSPRRRHQSFRRTLQRALRKGSSGDRFPESHQRMHAPRPSGCLQLFGLAAFRAAHQRMLGLARYMAARFAAEPGLELMAPVTLSVICFRFRSGVEPRIVLKKADGGRHCTGGPRRPQLSTRHSRLHRQLPNYPKGYWYRH